MTIDIELTRDVEWFVNRPLTRGTCPTCGGCGRVGHLYVLIPADPRIEGVPDDVICAVVRGAAWIWDCLTEAADIALRSRRTVAFRFIDETISVKPDDDPKELGRAWWIKRYGETPEQTASKR